MHANHNIWKVAGFQKLVLLFFWKIVGIDRCEIELINRLITLENRKNFTRIKYVIKCAAGKWPIDMIGNKKKEIAAQKVSRHFSINIFFLKNKNGKFFDSVAPFISFVVCRTRGARREKSFFHSRNGCLSLSYQVCFPFVQSNRPNLWTN